jgi:hypothetical protein
VGREQGNQLSAPLERELCLTPAATWRGVSTTPTIRPRPERDPSGDNAITIAWDNLSETTADPKTRWFDSAYRLWKAANWTCPVGSSGPNDDDWRCSASSGCSTMRPTTGPAARSPELGQFVDVCPTVWIPQGRVDAGLSENGDLWDNQSGAVIHPI